MARENKFRVFLDTNVIFSGLYSHHGAPGVILDCIYDGKKNIVISKLVLEELIRTINDKLPIAVSTLRAFLTSVPLEIQIDPPAEQVEQFTGELPFADAVILAAAINAKVDYFITGDRHFLENSDIAGESGLKIISPAEFARLVRLRRD
jgi:putative PIN family toxin of toxin-antitoxin system